MSNRTRYSAVDPLRPRARVACALTWLLALVATAALLSGCSPQSTPADQAEPTVSPTARFLADVKSDQGTGYGKVWTATDEELMSAARAACKTIASTVSRGISDPRYVIDTLEVNLPMPKDGSQSAAILYWLKTDLCSGGEFGQGNR